MLITRMAELGYRFALPETPTGLFSHAVRHHDLVFTSGQLPNWGDEQIKGKVGDDVDFDTAVHAAELCAYNCLRAVGTVADIEAIQQIVKVLGMVNVAPGFDNTSGVINGCSQFLLSLLGERGHHARSAVGMVIPAGWAVEIEMVVALGSP